MPVDKLYDFVDDLSHALTETEHRIADAIIKEIKNRIGFLHNVGLDYLTLARTAVTLSGGESQRIRLATQIGSALTGVLYILDEPSIGLHQRDNEKLLNSPQRAARSRQYPHRRRTRRGHDQSRRLHRGHRPDGGGARRRSGGVRHAGGHHGGAALDHGGLSRGAAENRSAGGARAARRTSGSPVRGCRQNNLKKRRYFHPPSG